MITVGGNALSKITGTGINKTIDFSVGEEKKAGSEGMSFAEMLSGAINNVNGLQKTADEQKMAFAAGKTDNIQDVMIAMEKADIAFQMTLQVRNKVLEAYQEIMRMPV